MSMKMTEGMERTNALFARLEAHGVVLSNSHYSVFRLFEAIAKEIDQALADGADHGEHRQDALDALASLGGNGHVAPLGSSLSEGIKASMEQGGLITRAKAFGYDPATADPVGVDLPDFPARSVSRVHYGTHEEILQQDAAMTRLSAANVAEVQRVAAEGGIEPALVTEGIKEWASDKPKRGRPKGSTNKAKKKAKAKRAPVPTVSAETAAEVGTPETVGEAAS